MKILVSGSDGQLGSELKVLSENNNWEWMFTDFKEMDITDPEKIEEVISIYRPDYFINSAAYTAVDKAEEDQEKCESINAEALKHITKLCNTYDCHLVHVSSDYVYHHNPERPLKETDDTLAQGVYAKTKLAGDQIVLAEAKSFVIVRTSWVYSSFGNNFVKTMIRLGTDRDALSIVSDQIGTPSYARDIADCIINMIKKLNDADDKTAHNGVYHFSNGGVTNWASFADEIFKQTGKEMAITPITTEDFNAPAPRPKWSVLSKDKIKDQFGIEIKDWKQSLSECLAVLGAK